MGFLKDLGASYTVLSGGKSEKNAGTLNEHEKILTALSEQQWFFFKNKRVVFDRETGLLLPDLNLYNIAMGDTWGEFKRLFPSDENGDFLKELDIDGVRGWKLPKKKELEKLMASDSFPFFYYKNAKQKYGIHDCSIRAKKDARGMDHIIRVLRIDSRTEQKCVALQDRFSGVDQECGILPVSDVLVRQIGSYEDIMSDFTRPTENRMETVLELLVNNGLVPIFADPSVTSLYESLYSEREIPVAEQPEPVRKEELSSGQSLDSFKNDIGSMLLEYDSAKIDASVIKYYKAVQSLTTSLLRRLARFEQEQRELIHEFNDVCMEMSRETEAPTGLSSEENALLNSLRLYLKGVLSLGMNEAKEKLHAIKKQANGIERHVEEINIGYNSIYALGQLEREVRASFALLAENMTDIVLNVLQKLVFLDEHRELVEKAAGICEGWTEDYKRFKIERLSALRFAAVKDTVNEETVEKWCEEWTKLRFAVERMIEPLLEWMIDRERSDSEAAPVAEEMISALNEYRSNVDNFYLEKRKEIHRKYAFKVGGEFRDKLETESELWKFTCALESKLQKIIFRCDVPEDRLFIIGWPKSLPIIHIDGVLASVKESSSESVSQEELDDFATLRQRNLEAYLSDAESYCRALEERERVYNTLLYKMVKGLK